MGKQVYLILEYDMGDYSDMEKEGLDIPTDPSFYRESFFQSGVNISDIAITGVRIIETVKGSND